MDAAAGRRSRCRYSEIEDLSPSCDVLAAAAIDYASQDISFVTEALRLTACTRNPALVVTAGCIFTFSTSPQHRSKQA
jgi:hypothetical protein